MLISYSNIPLVNNIVLHKYTIFLLTTYRLDDEQIEHHKYSRLLE